MLATLHACHMTCIFTHVCLLQIILPRGSLSACMHAVPLWQHQKYGNCLLLILFFLSHIQAEVLWLMAAKEKWLSGEVNVARQILSEAFTANSDSENIFLAAFKLEFENSELERARFILDKARASDSGSTQRVWMKSAIVERELGNAQAEGKVLQEGIAKFPYFDKLWLMLGQLEERRGAPDAARQVSVV